MYKIDKKIFTSEIFKYDSSIMKYLNMVFKTKEEADEAINNIKNSLKENSVSNARLKTSTNKINEDVDDFIERCNFSVAETEVMYSVSFLLDDSLETPIICKQNGNKTKGLPHGIIDYGQTLFDGVKKYAKELFDINIEYEFQYKNIFTDYIYIESDSGVQIFENTIVKLVGYEDIPKNISNMEIFEKVRWEDIYYNPKDYDIGTWRYSAQAVKRFSILSLINQEV